MRLLLDAHLSPGRIGEPLRALGHDVVALAEEPALRSLSDPAILELAHAERRVTVTCDAAHFAVLARAWAASGREHAGLVLVWSLRNSAFGEIVDGVRLLAEWHPRQDEWLNLVLPL